MLNNTNYESTICLIQTFVEILFDEKVSDDIKELRINGLKTLSSYLEYYQNCGYKEKLINKIAEKKTKMIMQIKSKSEMDKMLKPSCPYFNGSQFVPDKYNVIEEELICWSETSIIAPLNEVGFKRYMELFKKIFPDEEREIFKESYEENDNEDEFDEPNM